ncbi:aldose epimerase family protein [Steroidobacter flavus]|uniref:Aldose 1-epimerase n=1 Tax=Steroidobacter flavus TaxID=1842136 RepID=A0ABV8SWV1_9GAMM
MPVIKDTFGYLQDDRRVDRITLSHPRSGFSVEILEYGARIRAIHFPHPRQGPMNTVLSYASLREYELDTAALGAIIGRCANRTVARAHPEFQLSCNDGKNHLHGGLIGFGRSLWRTVACVDGDLPGVLLKLHSPDGDEGYRGNVSVQMEVRMDSPLSFRTVVTAATDRATPLNLTLHPYFNLTGDPDACIEDHELRLASSTYLPVSPEQIPTGEILAVDGTPFDFRRRTPIGARIHETGGGYDHYCPILPGAAIAAELSSRRSDIHLSVSTNQKGIQFYTGNSLADAMPRRFRARVGLCLEPHGFPNALNEPSFPSIMVQPGETYRHHTRYTFAVAED